MRVEGHQLPVCVAHVDCHEIVVAEIEIVPDAQGDRLPVHLGIGRGGGQQNDAVVNTPFGQIVSRALDDFHLGDHIRGKANEDRGQACGIDECQGQKKSDAGAQ